MTEMDLFKALRCCQNARGCTSCEALPGCSGIDVLIGQAADRLEALLAENERLKAQAPKWVSVEERLPELNVMVVGITKDNPFSRYVPQVVHRNEHGWVFTYSMRYVTDVTHWMPLPSTEGVE